MSIQRIGLKNWKNFKAVDVPCRLRVFLIGSNASGKSNFLDAIRFLRDVAENGLKKAVDDARHGVSAIRCLAATYHSDVEVKAEIATAGAIWDYQLLFNQDSNRRPIVKAEVVTRDGTILLSRPDGADEQDPERLTQTALEQISVNQSFRDVADFMKSIAYQHLIPQAVRDLRNFTPAPVKNDPFGRDFLMRVWQTPQRTRDSRLEKITQVLKIAVPQLSYLEIQIDDAGTPHLIGGYSHWRPHAARQNESQFSDGTLRLFGLLWTILEGSGPLLIEEPELSLHPEVVRYLPVLFWRMNSLRQEPRQMFISTHSRELISDPGIAAEEVLWLEPNPQGTLIRVADEADKKAMQAGLTAADVLLPKTTPANVQQLSLF